MKRKLIQFSIMILRSWYSLFYDKQYLKGKQFSSDHFSKGWRLLPKLFFMQKVIGWNREIPWPCAPNIMFGNYRNIHFCNDDLDNFFSSGNYYQGIGASIIIGRGTAIAPGVGIITSNHDFSDLSISSEGKTVKIGEECWIGMNAVILPGVELGNHTIVGAGSIVTKSFEGNCVIAGNPARLIRELG